MRPAPTGLSYAATRPFRTAFPKVTITAPTAGVRFEHDVDVTMRDGVRLRVNVFRPERPGRFPVILSAHPYGKDIRPRRSPLGYLALVREPLAHPAPGGGG
jgi:predicted acyl esterase